MLSSAKKPGEVLDATLPEFSSSLRAARDSRMRIGSCSVKVAVGVGVSAFKTKPEKAKKKVPDSLLCE